MEIVSNRSKRNGFYKEGGKSINEEFLGLRHAQFLWLSWNEVSPQEQYPRELQNRAQEGYISLGPQPQELGVPGHSEAARP